MWTFLSHWGKLKKAKKRISTSTLLGIKKSVEHESDGDINCNWCSWYSHQRIDTRTGGFGNKRTSGDHPNYYTIEIGQNTERTPGDLRWLAVTQTPVINHRLTLSWKTPKGVTIIIKVFWLAQIPLTLSHHPSPWAIDHDWFSRRYSVFAHSWGIKVFADRPTLVCPCVGVHWRTFLMSLCFLLQEYSAYFARLTWIVCEIGGWWSYNCCFVGCCFQGLFKTAHSIPVEFPSSFFTRRFVKSKWCIHIVVLTCLQIIRIRIHTYWILIGDELSVIVIAVVNGIGDPSSNLNEAVCASFHMYPLGKGMTPLFELYLWVNSRADCFFWVLVGQRANEKEKILIQWTLFGLKIDLVSHLISGR